MDDLDIYKDLDDFIDNTKQNELILEKNRFLKEKQGFQSKIEKQQREIEELQKINQILKKNISALFKTAQKEIRKKSKIIGELKKELDDLKFRRTGRSYNKPYEHRRNKRTLDIEDHTETKRCKIENSVITKTENKLSELNSVKTVAHVEPVTTATLSIGEDSVKSLVIDYDKVSSNCDKSSQSNVFSDTASIKSIEDVDDHKVTNKDNFEKINSPESNDKVVESDDDLLILTQGNNLEKINSPDYCSSQSDYDSQDDQSSNYHRVIFKDIFDDYKNRCLNRNKSMDDLKRIPFENYKNECDSRSRCSDSKLTDVLNDIIEPANRPLDLEEQQLNTENVSVVDVKQFEETSPKHQEQSQTERVHSTDSQNNRREKQIIDKVDKEYSRSFGNSRNSRRDSVQYSNERNSRNYQRDSKPTFRSRSRHSPRNYPERREYRRSPSPKSYSYHNQFSRNRRHQSPRHRSKSRLRYRSPRRFRSKSPIRRRSKSPAMFRPKSPARFRPKSPAEFRPKSPARFRSKSPAGFRPKSPARFRSKSPARFRSKSPAGFRPKSPARFRSKSPGGFRPKSPARFRSKSPAGFRPKSPARFRSKSPAGFRPKSPVDFRSKSPLRQRPKSPLRYKSKSPIRRSSQSPARYRLQSPGRYRSKSPLKFRLKSPVRQRSHSPIRYRSKSPTRIQDETSGHLSPLTIRFSSPSPGTIRTNSSEKLRSNSPAKFRLDSFEQSYSNRPFSRENVPELEPNRNRIQSPVENVRYCKEDESDLRYERSRIMENERQRSSFGSNRPHTPQDRQYRRTPPEFAQSRHSPMNERKHSFSDYQDNHQRYAGHGEFQQTSYNMRPKSSLSTYDESFHQYKNSFVENYHNLKHTIRSRSVSEEDQYSNKSEPCGLTRPAKKINLESYRKRKLSNSSGTNFEEVKQETTSNFESYPDDARKIIDDRKKLHTSMENVSSDENSDAFDARMILQERRRKIQAGLKVEVNTLTNRKIISTVSEEHSSTYDVREDIRHDYEEAQSELIHRDPVNFEVRNESIKGVTKDFFQNNLLTEEELEISSSSPTGISILNHNNDGKRQVNLNLAERNGQNTLDKVLVLQNGTSQKQQVNNGLEYSQKMSESDDLVYTVCDKNSDLEDDDKQPDNLKESFKNSEQLCTSIENNSAFQNKSEKAFDNNLCKINDSPQNSKNVSNLVKNSSNQNKASDEEYSDSNKGVKYEVNKMENKGKDKNLKEKKTTSSRRKRLEPNIDACKKNKVTADQDLEARDVQSVLEKKIEENVQQQSVYKSHGNCDNISKEVHSIQSIETIDSYKDKPCVSKNEIETLNNGVAVSEKVYKGIQKSDKKIKVNSSEKYKEKINNKEIKSVNINSQAIKKVDSKLKQNTKDDKKSNNHSKNKKGCEQQQIKKNVSKNKYKKTPEKSLENITNKLRNSQELKLSEHTKEIDSKNNSFDNLDLMMAELQEGKVLNAISVENCDAKVELNSNSTEDFNYLMESSMSLINQTDSECKTDLKQRRKSYDEKIEILKSQLIKEAENVTNSSQLAEPSDISNLDKENKNPEIANAPQSLVDTKERSAKLEQNELQTVNNSEKTVGEISISNLLEDLQNTPKKNLSLLNEDNSESLNKSLDDSELKQINANSSNESSDLKEVSTVPSPNTVQKTAHSTYSREITTDNKVRIIVRRNRRR